MVAVTGLSHVLIQTRDLARAEAFYVGLLGFSIRERGRFGDERPLLVTREGLGLTVLPTEQQLAPGGQSLEHVAFKVRDIVALEARLRDAGITIEDGPKPTVYGTSLYVRDPDGNRIECHD